jgi:hypothetical protein
MFIKIAENNYTLDLQHLHYQIFFDVLIPLIFAETPTRPRDII